VAPKRLGEGREIQGIGLDEPSLAARQVTRDEGGLSNTQVVINRHRPALDEPINQVTPDEASPPDDEGFHG
jgi:hypothetical protein